MNKKQKKMLYRILLCSLLLILLRFLPLEGFLSFLLYLIPYLIIGYDILLKAWKGIRKKQIFDENFLMAVATIGALLLGVTKTNDYIEGIAVMLFYQIGELFQSYAVGKSRRNISSLMDIRPDYANIEKNGQLLQMDPYEISIGSNIIVQPGEKIPIDGIVTKGISNLNTSALTGESLPRDVKEGDEIISGCINLTGVLEIKTTKEFEESTVSKILDLVENATSRKSKSEAFISKFAKVYTPFVCYSALALAVLPPLFSFVILHSDPQWGNWLYRALTFLVISCPCALVISIPLSFFAGIGGASKEGILIKGSNYLETLSQTKVVVFDKTGTLTEGTFEVTDILNNTISKDKLLEFAALAECSSSHPISKSLQHAYGKEIDRNRVTNIEEISGYGVTAIVDHMSVAVGNTKLMKKLSIDYAVCNNTGTVIYVAIDQKFAGYIIISDKIKTSSQEAIKQLKKNGIHKTIMLTGDLNSVAENVASKLQLDEVKSELLPNQKVEELEKILQQTTSGKVTFIGDGINDAPVLSLADIGIAMGAMGSDAAIEAADVVLMDDDPLKIVKAIKISKKCIGIVYQNIIFSLVIKFGCLILGAFGIANMWFAIFADVGVMVLTVLNAIRALRVHHL